jgi:hypothetical protein
MAILRKDRRDDCGRNVLADTGFLRFLRKPNTVLTQRASVATLKAGLDDVWDAGDVYRSLKDEHK